MRAIILAAGRGSRMKKLTEQTPKCLLEVNGKALLDWQIGAIRKAGIEEIAIVTGYKRELLINRGLVEFHNERWSETNMVESLSIADAWLQHGPCIVSYSDLIYGHEAVQSLVMSDSLIAITYDPNWLELWKKRFEDPLEDAETFRLNSDSEVVEIGGQPGSISEIEGQYMGLIRVTPKGWEEFNRVLNALSQQARDEVNMTSILQKIVLLQSVPVVAVPYSGNWGEFDSFKDLGLFQL